MKLNIVHGAYQFGASQGILDLVYECGVGRVQELSLTTAI
jgi:hypothetical protein